MTDKYQMLHDKYQSTAYGKRNVLDGQFKGMMRIYETMYGKYMPVDKDANILDIACGAGQFLKFLLNNEYTNFTGVDLSKEQIEYCETHVPGRAILTDGLEYLNDRPYSFDLITANDFIEHLTKEKGIEFVGLTFQALRLGGRLILKTGNMSAFGGLAIWCNTLDHECGYTERSLQSLLGMWGFQDIEIIPYYPLNKQARRKQLIFHWILRQMYKHFFAGDYPKCYTKMIAVTGVKK